MKKISANYIFPVTGKPIKNGVITVDDQGVITEISEPKPTDTDVEHFDGVLVPGFVNTHCHLELSYMKGVLPQHTGLPGFVKQIMETKFSFPEDVQREAIARADADMWSTGVNAVGDISNTTVSFATKRDSKIKYVTFLEIFDVIFGVDYREIVAQGEELSQAAKDYGIEAYVTPHSTYGVSKKLYEAYSKMDNTECPSIHFMESADDDLLFSKQGEFWELFQEKGLPVDFFDEESSTNRILKYISSDKRLLLVHDTNVKSSDLDALKSRYPKLSFALCPQSNLYIEQKLPPVELLISKDLNLSIGTDSLSSNTELSMVAEMRAFCQNFDLGFEQVLSWATLGGAIALGLEREMGSLEVGKKPGIVLIEGLGENFSFGAESCSRRII